MCKVEDGAVERVPDSSRYFVIKIQNAQGRHAFVGLAFDDRNQAFDFNVALQEFKKYVLQSFDEMRRRGGGGTQEAVFFYRCSNEEVGTCAMLHWYILR